MPALLVCAASAAIAWTSLVHYAENASLIRLASIIERGQTALPGVIERQLGAVSTSAREGVCDDKTKRASITIALARADRQNVAVDYEGWLAAVGEAERTLRAAIACSPHDGNLWARLALVQRAAAASASEIVPSLSMSQRLAPAEIDVLLARFQLWRSGADWLVPVAGPLLERDIRTVVTQARSRELGMMIADPPPALAAELHAQIALLPPERAAELERIETSAATAAEKARDPLFDLLNRPPPPR